MPHTQEVLSLIGDMGQMYGESRFPIRTVVSALDLPPEEVTSILFGADTEGEGEFPVRCVEFERVLHDTGWYDPNHIVHILPSPLAHCTFNSRCSQINVCPIRERKTEEIPLIQPGSSYERNRPIVAEELPEILMSIPVRQQIARIIRSHQVNSHWNEERFAVLYDAESTKVGTVPFTDNTLRSSKPTDHQLEQVHYAVNHNEERFVFDLHLHPMDTLRTPRQELRNPLAPSVGDLVSSEMWYRSSGGTVNPIMGICNVLSDTNIRLLLYKPTKNTLNLDSIAVSDLVQNGNDYGVRNEGVLELLRTAGYRAELLEMDLLKGFSDSEREKFKSFALSIIELR